MFKKSVVSPKEDVEVSSHADQPCLLDLVMERRRQAAQMPQNRHAGLRQDSQGSDTSFASNPNSQARDNRQSHAPCIPNSPNGYNGRVHATDRQCIQRHDGFPAFVPGSGTSTGALDPEQSQSQYAPGSGSSDNPFDFNIQWAQGNLPRSEAIVLNNGSQPAQTISHYPRITGSDSGKTRARRRASSMQKTPKLVTSTTIPNPGLACNNDADTAAPSWLNYPAMNETVHARTDLTSETDQDMFDWFPNNSLDQNLNFTSMNYGSSTSLSQMQSVAELSAYHSPDSILPQDVDQDSVRSATKRVRIDALCSADQLGALVQAVMELTKSATVDTED